MGDIRDAPANIKIREDCHLNIKLATQVRGLGLGLGYDNISS